MTKRVVLIDTDDSYTHPTGKNIRHALSDLIRSADPDDVLFFHYSSHGTRLPAETGEDDDTGYDECIVPCHMNLIIDDDYREFVDRREEGRERVRERCANLKRENNEEDGRVVSS